MSQFVHETFQARKYLLSMVAGERRSLPIRICKHMTIKNTASQLKKLGHGCWKVSMKKLDGQMSIVRIS